MIKRENQNTKKVNDVNLCKRVAALPAARVLFVCSLYIWGEGNGGSFYFLVFVFFRSSFYRIKLNIFFFKMWLRGSRGKIIVLEVKANFGS